MPHYTQTPHCSKLLPNQTSFALCMQKKWRTSSGNEVSTPCFATSADNATVVKEGPLLQQTLINSTCLEKFAQVSGPDPPDRHGKVAKYTALINHRLATSASGPTAQRKSASIMGTVMEANTKSHMKLCPWKQSSTCYQMSQ